MTWNKNANICMGCIIRETLPSKGAAQHHLIMYLESRSNNMIWLMVRMQSDGVMALWDYS